MGGRLTLSVPDSQCACDARMRSVPSVESIELNLEHLPVLSQPQRGLRRYMGALHARVVVDPFAAICAIAANEGVHCSEKRGNTRTHTHRHAHGHTHTRMHTPTHVRPHVRPHTIKATHNTRTRLHIRTHRPRARRKQRLSHACTSRIRPRPPDVHSTAAGRGKRPSGLNVTTTTCPCPARLPPPQLPPRPLALVGGW